MAVRNCGICDRPDVAQIDQAIRAGHGKAEVSKAFKLPAGQLTRHLRHSGRESIYDELPSRAELERRREAARKREARGGALPAAVLAVKDW